MFLMGSLRVHVRSATLHVRTLAKGLLLYAISLYLGHTN